VINNSPAMPITREEYWLALENIGPVPLVSYRLDHPAHGESPQEQARYRGTQHDVAARRGEQRCEIARIDDRESSDNEKRYGAEDHGRHPYFGSGGVRL